MSQIPKYDYSMMLQRIPPICLVSQMFEWALDWFYDAIVHLYMEHQPLMTFVIEDEISKVKLATGQCRFGLKVLKYANIEIPCPVMFTRTSVGPWEKIITLKPLETCKIQFPPIPIATLWGMISSLHHSSLLWAAKC